MSELWQNLSDPVTLSRLQFALTTAFHILWPLASIGLSIMLVVLEAMWLKTGEQAYYQHARFWSKLFLLNFAVGVASGLPLEFQFGTNWGPFADQTNGFFGNVLGFEGAMAFMLEAGFLGVMLLGWKRVPKGLHLFSTAMVALGASLSAFWIMVANSWMQTPAGGHFENGRFVVTDYLAAIFNPDAFWGVSHMWVACLETTAFAVGAVSAWYIWRNRHAEFFLRTFKLALVAAVALAPLQFVLGDSSGLSVAKYQPAKLAAVEAHWHTNPPGQPAAWKLLAWPDQAKQDNVWSLEIPYGLSLIVTRSLTGSVRGLTEFPLDDQAPVWIVFYSFRIMFAIGSALILLMLLTAWVWKKGGLTPTGLTQRKWLLASWLAAGPAAYVAVLTGWVTREVGRQPWIIYNQVRTKEVASALPASEVGLTLAAYATVYTLLLVAFLVAARRILQKGPDLTPESPKRASQAAAQPKAA
ncbi:MAG: cytochrome ubiquinol oxidase subunit I [Deltaproteobacteria bacterium]|nr:cytochrome ubiquinol oxidase subunit I [Deltaproteobacteria bacterium]